MTDRRNSKVYGLVICLAGLFNFIQSPLDALTHKTFDKDPVPVNVGLLALALVVGGTLVAYVARKAYNMERELLEEEAEAAPEVAMPTANGDGHGYGSVSH